jgi:glycosyltransferase involved in cell wall biosynthesis
VSLQIKGDWTVEKERYTIGMFSYHMRVGGVERVISILTPVLIKMGHKVVVITNEAPTEKDYKLPPEVKRYTISGCMGDGERRRADWQSVCEKEHIDVMLYHVSQTPYLLQETRTIKQYVKYFVLYKHQLFSEELTYFDCWYGMYEDVFPLCDRIVVLSRLEMKYWNMQGYRTVYMPNPSDYNCKIEKQNWNYIVWTGRLDYLQKNYLDPIAVMKVVHRRFPQIQLKMFGSGTGLCEKYLLEEIKKAGLEDAIIYCGNERDINRLYGEARIQLVTSSYEAFPMALMEGKMFSLPLVTYDMPYLEALREQKGYIAVKQRDTEAAAKAIIRILETPKLEMSMRSEAETSAASFSNDVVVEKWDELLQNLSGDFVCDPDDAVTAEDARQIFRTIYGHSEAAADRYRRLKDKYWSERMDKIISQIKYMQKKEGRKLVLYPYGKIGKQVQEFLHEHGVYEELVADNHAENAVPMSYFEGKNTDGYILLFCSKSGKYYEKLREDAYKYFKKDNVIELFSEEDIIKNIL